MNRNWNRNWNKNRNLDLNETRFEKCLRRFIMANGCAFMIDARPIFIQMNLKISSFKISKNQIIFLTLSLLLLLVDLTRAAASSQLKLIK